MNEEKNIDKTTEAADAEVNETRKTEDTADMLDNIDTLDNVEQAELSKTAAPSESAKAEEAPAAETPATAEIPVESAPEAQYAFRWDYSTQAEADAKAKKKSSGRGAWIYAGVMSAVFGVSFLILALFVIFGRGVDTNIIYNGTASIEQIAAERALPSTVLVYTDSGSGTGIVLSEDGYIATNHHVIEPAISGGKVYVQLYGGTREYEAKIVGYSAGNDVAVIKINENRLIPAKIGNSDALVIGENVVAIGNPGGYNFSVSDGIVSSINRELQMFSDDGIYQRTLYVIQTTAPVNPGNSGGPLVNKEGEVIGIVSMKTATGDEGIGFALPINGCMKLIDAIIKTGSADGVDSSMSTERPMLGISAIAVRGGHWYVRTDTGFRMLKDEAEANETEGSFYIETTGIYIDGVEKDKSCWGILEEGDIITHLGDKEVSTLQGVSYVLSGYHKGEVISIVVVRDGESMELFVTLK